MSTTLIVLGSILALFAVVLIPLMMMKPQQEVRLDHPRDHGNERKKSKKKKK